ncbi:hypothetical protein GIB67_005513 [Kingdonia uniflora]|uniref:Ribosomal protein L27 n=1 Tax=Kingdonia uniflora TaxID=39325 RepID=A0A7J7NHC8_9MAGN|nr:hypothetical protein GIB67_005513 [Kingdonia uniflora]
MLLVWPSVGIEGRMRVREGLLWLRKGLSFLVDDMSVKCWGSSSIGLEISKQFGNVSMLSLVAEDSHVCGLTVIGYSVCNERNDSGQLDVLKGSNGFEFDGFAMGVNHSCAIRSVNGAFDLEINMMNFSATLCRRVNVREMVTSVPVYSGLLDASEGGLSLMIRRWATKKTAGSTKNGRDSNPKFLGVKKFGGERVIPGNIIVRQRGTRFHPGNYVGLGKDHTLYALKEGCVKFQRHKLSGRKFVHIEPKDGHVVHPVYTTNVAPKLETTV